MNSSITLPRPLLIDYRSMALGIPGRLLRAIKTVETWRRRQQLRAQFASVDRHTLRDAGISQARHFVEINKAFWEA